MADKLDAYFNNLPNPALRYMRLGFIVSALLFAVFLAGYSWLSWKGVENNQLAELSSIAELSGNALDSYFSQYAYSLKTLSVALDTKKRLSTIPLTDSD